MDQKEKGTVRILKSLANPRRLEIILHLKKHRALNVSSVAEKLDLSVRSTSKHLAHLENAGLASRRQQSREVYYTLSPEIPSEVIALFARMSE